MYSSTQACSSTAGVNLVIDEINFHSDSTLDAGDWIELYNHGSTSLNISNCVLLDGDTREKYCIIPNNTILNAGQRLVIYEDSLKFAVQFPSVTNKIGPLCFKLNDGGQKITLNDKDNKLITTFTFDDTWQCSADGRGRTLQLLSTSANPNNATSWYAGCIGGSPGVTYSPCTENPMYSEINYFSAATSDAGDWFELHNKNSTPFNLSGWSVRNGVNSNVFTFSSGTTIPAAGYLVLYSDATKFASEFPSVTNKVGPIGFNLNDTDDVIRLYDNTGKLKYSVCYSSSAPWPSAANAGGKTLENGQYAGNHNEASTWFAGCPKGSPGKAYDPSCAAIGFNTEEASAQTIQVYPNPTTSILYIESAIPLTRISVVDVMGREVFSTTHSINQINVAQLATGNYVLKCSNEKGAYVVKFEKE
jgi:Lamin Tail Domain/Secretion system C-terminal sorting domain